MAKKLELHICLGSSCFARGNKKMVHDVQSYVEDKQLQDKILLKGGHCFANCVKGPIVKFHDEIHENVTFTDVVNMLNKKLGE